MFIELKGVLKVVNTFLTYLPLRKALGVIRSGILETASREHAGSVCLGSYGALQRLQRNLMIHCRSPVQGRMQTGGPAGAGGQAGSLADDLRGQPRSRRHRAGQVC